MRDYTENPPLRCRTCLDAVGVFCGDCKSHMNPESQDYILEKLKEYLDDDCTVSHSIMEDLVECLSEMRDEIVRLSSEVSELRYRIGANIEKK